MIKVGVSACVLGENVRFDGGHKKSGYVVSYLSKAFDLVPTCPEMGIGMSAPRPAIRLMEDESGQVRLVDSKDSSLDYTEDMAGFFAKKKSTIAQLDGYILAAKSPTCGAERIKVYGPDGSLNHRKGQGVFVSAIQRAFPDLPIEEDGRLNDAGLREAFITKVYVHHRLRTEVLCEPSVASLVAFHARHKYLLMAYSPEAYKSLGQMVAQSANGELENTLARYKGALMQALSKPTNRKKHSNVLMHMQGYFKKQLSKSDKQELSQQIEDFRLGYLPLMAPITLMKHYLKEYPNPYLANQVYLQPYPQELGLRA